MRKKVLFSACLSFLLGMPAKGFSQEPVSLPDSEYSTESAVHFIRMAKAA
ncbi:hypothetical protein [Bacteroides sp.]|nr:hypothetical protein [Bacteroides sp.]MDE5759498.1 hypothetical protein [Bacteroides sp.]MDE6216249.1 hypothetical protein [Bacteroides sp.]